MTKKIAFFDVDGTMIDVPNGLMSPTEKTIEVLKKFQSEGNYIVVATARTNISKLKDIGFDGYICSDGHYIEFHSEVLINNIFSDEELLMLIDVCERHNGGCLLGGYTGEWASTKDNSVVIKHHALYAGTEDMSNVTLVKDALGNISANSITGVFSDASDMFKAKEELPKDWVIHSYGDDNEIDIRMDIHHSGFSKGTACEFLYKHLGINKENSYAFGDGSNDIEMLQLVGTGIAMGSANDNVKEAADYVTLSVSEEGIYEAFKKLNI